MNYINNFNRPITLGAAATTAALDLPDGTFRLCISNAARTQLEVLDAAVTSGSATLTRGLEGTTAQAWPEGSSVYASVTAGMLAGLGGGSVLRGTGSPVGIVLAPGGSHYINNSDPSAVWYAKDDDEWVRLKVDDDISLITGTRYLSGLERLNEHGMMLDGDSFLFQGFGSVYSNVTLVDLDGYLGFSSGAQRYHYQLITPGDGSGLFVATLVSEYLG